MKLFKSLLVAPAALGLLAPMAATANEVTVNDFNPSIENTLLAGGEGLVTGSSYDGSFSETTSASFSADFAIGAVDGASNEKVTTGFGYQIDLSTSFTALVPLLSIATYPSCPVGCQPSLVFNIVFMKLPLSIFLTSMFLASCRS